MNVPASPAAGGDREPAAAPRPPLDRRLLDRVFGEALPTSTKDDLPDPVRESGGSSDDWYHANRPPHHE